MDGNDEEKLERRCRGEPRLLRRTDGNAVAARSVSGGVAKA